MRKNPIQTTINGKPQLIVYIEYQDDKPFSVITCNPDLKGLYTWDFELNLNWDEYMYYNSGCGGDIKKLTGPHYIEGANVSYWAADSVKFDKKYPPINCARLERPVLLLNGNSQTEDPFVFAMQEVRKIIYCDVCDGRYDENGCSEHMDMWEYKYLDGREID